MPRPLVPLPGWHGYKCSRFTGWGNCNLQESFIPDAAITPPVAANSVVLNRSAGT